MKLHIGIYYAVVSPISKTLLSSDLRLFILAHITLYNLGIVSFVNESNSIQLQISDWFKLKHSKLEESKISD